MLLSVGFVALLSAKRAFLSGNNLALFGILATGFLRLSTANYAFGHVIK